MTRSLNNAENPSRTHVLIDKTRGMIKKYKSFLDIIVPILILLIGVGIVIYYIAGPSKFYMTGDSTDSLRWAQASFESGKLISDNFAYAAILPFGGNLIFYPFIAAFGYSMAAQIGGLIVFAILLAAALYYMLTGIGMNRYASAITVSLFFIIMSSSPKLREIMWEHIFYYNLGILFFAFGTGLVARILEYKDNAPEIPTEKRITYLIEWAAVAVLSAVSAFAAIKAMAKSVSAFFIVMDVIIIAAAAYILVSVILKRTQGEASQKIRVAVLGIFSVLAATDGLQTLVCFTLPIFAGLFAERFFCTDDPIFSKKTIFPVAAAVVLVIGSAFGYMKIEMVSGGITAGYADAYSTYSAMSTWVNNFLGFFTNWFSLMGVSVAAKDPLVSKESIINIIRIFGAIFFLVAPAVLLVFYKKIKSRGVKIALFGHFAVSAFILFAVTFGRLGGANWRLTPMLGTSVLLSLIAAFELIKVKKGLALRLGVLFLCVLMLVAFPAAKEIKDMSTETGDNAAWHIAAEELESRGLKYGYANFWFAETITMLSDNKVQVANIYENQARPYKYVYQISESAFEDKPDAENGYFLLLTKAENENMSGWLRTMETNGKIIDSFEIATAEYNLRGHTGNSFFVYVFSENIF